MRDACVDPSSESRATALKLEGKTDGGDRLLEAMSGIRSQEVERLGSRPQEKDEPGSQEAALRPRRVTTWPHDRTGPKTPTKVLCIRSSTGN